MGSLGTDNSTSISYEKVSSDAQTIMECAKTMQAIFDNFGSSMNQVGAEDVFYGSASETLGARFQSLKSKFNDYVLLVENFSKGVTAISQSTQDTEKALEQDAENLAG